MVARYARIIMSRAIIYLALGLLGLQGFIIFLDMSMETYILDEVLGFLITGALTWLVKKQRDIYRKEISNVQ